MMGKDAVTGSDGLYDGSDKPNHDAGGREPLTSNPIPTPLLLLWLLLVLFPLVVEVVKKEKRKENNDEEKKILR
jgi:hypothetical protein